MKDRMLDSVIETISPGKRRSIRSDFDAVDSLADLTDGKRLKRPVARHTRVNRLAQNPKRSSCGPVPEWRFSLHDQDQDPLSGNHAVNLRSSSTPGRETSDRLGLATPRAKPAAPVGLRREVQLLYDVWVEQKTTGQSTKPSGLAVRLTRSRLATFDAVLQLYYPKAPKDELCRLRQLVTTREERERRGWLKRTQRERQTIVDMFGCLDEDGNAAIDYDEFSQASAAAGLNQQEIMTLFRKYDADDNGVLDFEEFTHLIANHAEVMHLFDDILRHGAARKEVRALRGERRSVPFRELRSFPSKV
eukprot:CAMPEP_0119322414 /NCGR_PEP_ID=MMETSP1333-20130426/58112_1 /TAXON_ID=418940 /ORGANISM="Scyphosphaera apsteinii, Strain RCC1455" /LENGTH=303 /DNA_ID=CAMNT_0007329641 /DNA_START=97 /DNA_END=1008 /DNA_ORIENTATION=+